jgi:hypothetical protein
MVGGAITQHAELFAFLLWQCGSRALRQDPDAHRFTITLGFLL